MYMCVYIYITHAHTHTSHILYMHAYGQLRTRTQIYVDRILIDIHDIQWIHMDSSAASLAASNGLVCIALAVLDAHMLFMPGVGANDSPMAESEANLRG